MGVVKRYVNLSKPGIVRSNAMAAVAGYCFAGLDSFTLSGLVHVLIGTTLVVASACVFNNIIDRDIDARMERTAKRAIPTHDISIRSAATFGAIMLLVGSLTLYLGVGILPLGIALVGFVAYVGLYTFSKRVTTHSTLIGTISGSTPPVIGYSAATGHLDISALLLFLVLVAWQMPHFYAIGIFRLKQYKAAKIPILPVVAGLERTRKEIIAYALLFIAACIMLSVYGGATWLFGVVMTLVSLRWVWLCLKPAVNVEKWAKKQFLYSLFVLLTLCLMLILDGLVLRPLLHL